MTHPNEKLYTSTHTQNSECPQDPPLGINPFFAAHQAKLAALRDNPPRTVEDPFACGLGRMAPDPEKPGKGLQLPDKVEHKAWTLREMYHWVQDHSRVCPKFDAPCFYTAVPAEPCSSKKSNFHHSGLVSLDLDGTIKDERGLKKLRRWCQLFGCILYSSARHDPANGIFRLRVVLLLNASLGYEEHRRVAAAICAQLAAYLGTSEGVDSCTERAFQPMLLPGWATQELKDQALLELFEGEAFDVTLLLAQARVEIEEAAAVLRAQACAVVATRRPRLISSASTATATAGVDGIDALARAQLDLEDLGPIRAGGGTSNRDLFRAAAVLRDWEVDLGDAIAEMQSRYSDQDPAWLEAKTRSAYDAGVGSPRTGWRIRAAVAEVKLTFEGMYELESSAPVAPPTSECGDSASALHATPPLSGAVDNNYTLGVIDLYTKNTPSVYGKNCENTPAPPARTRREVHTPALPDLHSFDHLPARVTGVQSPTGTRKNIHLKPAMRNLMANGGRAITLSHRRSLSRNQSRGWGIPCYLDTKSGQIGGSTSVCLDSVHRIAGGAVDVVILDEVEQMFRHLFGATIRKRAQVGVVFCALRDLLRRAKRIILLDADLSPRAMFYMRVLLGDDVDEQVIVNTWQPDRRIRIRSQAGMFSDLVVKVDRGERVWLYCTSRNQAKAYKTRLQALFPGIKMILVCSETAGQAECKAALEDPQRFADYQIVLATPSVGTGVSVEHQGTWHVFGDCQSGCGSVATDCKQGLCRVRDPLSTTICVHGPRKYENTNPEFVLADLLTLSARTVRRLRGQQWSAKYQHGHTTPEIPSGGFTFAENGENLPEVEIRDYDIDILRVQAEVMADAAHQGNHLHDIEVKDEQGLVTEILEGSLFLHLKACGWGLVYIPDEIGLDVQASAKDHKAAKQVVKVEWVGAVMAAPDLSDEEAKALQDAGASTPEDVTALARWKIRRFYGVEKPDRELVERDDQGARRRLMAEGAQLRAHQRGEGQAVDRLDRLDARAGVSSHLEHRGKKAQLRAGLWALLGIKDLELDAQAGTVIRAQVDLAANKDLVRDVRQYLKITLKKGMAPMLVARALAAGTGVKLDHRPVTLPDGSRGREYVLERDSVSLMVEDCGPYYGRLTNPGARTNQAELEALRRRDAEIVENIASAFDLAA